VNALASIVANANVGRNIILGMLATGGVFIGVIALGQLVHWAGSKKNKH
jgi:hypothetical protein